MKLKMIINNNKFTIVFIICFLISSLFLMGMFFNTLKVNPVKLKINLDNKVFTFVPQGWAFFTRNPREAQIILYKVDEFNNLKEIKQRHSSYRNIFGLNRRASKIMSELQFIKKDVNDSLFNNTKWNYQEAILNKIPSNFIEVTNQLEEPILCGEFVVVFQKAVPWAWSRNLSKIEMPAKIIRLKIICD